MTHLRIMKSSRGPIHKLIVFDCTCDTQNLRFILYQINSRFLRHDICLHKTFCINRLHHVLLLRGRL